MHEWLFDNVYDDDYWPEYVNLCISHGRVSIAKNVNILIPVSAPGLTYPIDIPCSTEHIISVDGVLGKKPQASYIFRVDVNQSYSNIWQNTDEMDAFTTALNKSFKEYGAPKVLEVTSPIQTPSFSEELFLLCCSHLEKSVKKFTPMKIALVNGSGNKRTRPSSCICTIEDILKFKSLLKERKIRIQFSIDFPALMSTKRDTNYNQKEIFGALVGTKNSIICLNITDVKKQSRTQPKTRTIGDDETDVYYLNRYNYPVYDDFLYNA